MDKDRIAGSVKTLKGSTKETIGEVTGDTRLQVEGSLEKSEGKVRNTIGNLKDKVRDSLKK